MLITKSLASIHSAKPSHLTTARLIVLSPRLPTPTILPLNSEGLTRAVRKPVVYTIVRLHAVEVQTRITVRQGLLTALVVYVRAEATTAAAEPLVRSQVFQMRGLRVVAGRRVVLTLAAAVVVVGAVELGVGWGTGVCFVGRLAAWWHCAKKRYC